MEPIADIEINHLSIPGFVIDVKPHRTFIRLPTFPKDVHLTFSYHPKSQDFNIHLTRENGAENKPHIKLVLIEKAELIRNIESLALLLVTSLFEAIDKSSLKEKCKYWLPMEDNKNTQSIFKDSFYNATSGTYSIKRKTRLKVSEHPETIIETIVKDEAVISHFEKQEAIHIDNIAVGAYQSLNEDQDMIIVIEDQILALKKDKFDLTQVLQNLLGEELYTILEVKYVHTLKEIETADTYQDTNHLNVPIRLTWVSDQN